MTGAQRSAADPGRYKVTGDVHLALLDDDGQVLLGRQKKLQIRRDSERELLPGRPPTPPTRCPTTFAKPEDREPPLSCALVVELRS